MTGWSRWHPVLRVSSCLPWEVAFRWLRDDIEEEEVPGRTQPRACDRSCWDTKQWQVGKSPQTWKCPPTQPQTNQMKHELNQAKASSVSINADKAQCGCPLAISEPSSRQAAVRAQAGESLSLDFLCADSCGGNPGAVSLPWLLTCPPSPEGDPLCNPRPGGPQ